MPRITDLCEDSDLLAGMKFDRVASMMCDWWAEASLARIARKHGISRQRAGQILGWCGCTADVLHRAKRDSVRGDSRRRAIPQRVAEARLLLEHPLASRLTARQRCALLWMSQGLTLVDTARRMAATAQAVNGFLVGARWHLERLERRGAPVPLKTGGGIGAADIAELDAFDVRGLLDSHNPAGPDDQ